MSAFKRFFDIIALTAISFGYFLFPWKINQGTAVVGSGLILWLACNLRDQNTKKTLKDPLIILISVFLLICILQSIKIPEAWSASAADSISRYYKYLFSIIAIAAMSDQRIRNISVKAFFSSILLIVISMHLNIFWNLPWSNTTIKGWGNDQTVVGDYITQNLFVCLFIILSLDFFRNSKFKYQKIFFLITFIAGVHAILFLSIGRTGYLLITTALGVYSLWAIQSRWKWLTLFTLIGTVAIAIHSSQHASDRVKLALSEANTAIASIKNNQVPDLTSIGARIYMWDQTWQIITQKPLKGWGVGSYPHQWCKNVPNFWCNETAKYHPHNQYLMFWVELGIAGLLIFLVMIFYLINKGIKDNKNGGVLLSLTVILLVDSFINSPFYVRREYQFFLLCIPLAYSLLKNSQDNNYKK